MAYSGLSRVLWLGLACAAGVASASAAQAFDLPPYEASYDIRLIHASESKGPRAATGAFEFRVDQTCDGWETKSHTLIDLTFGDELRATNERFFSSWEAKTGRSYRFAVQTVKNGKTVEAFKGTASLAKQGGEVLYEPLQGPGKPVKLALPPGTLLPEAHVHALVEHAREGDPLFRSVVLSGASSTGPRVMSIAIGARLGEASQNISPLAETIDPKLLKTPGWQMSTAAFNLNEHRETPNFEMSIQFHDSGVVQYFEQTFGDFTIAATLTRLQELPPTCN